MGHASVILVLRECIWKAPTVSLVISNFDYTSFLGSPPSQGVYPPGSMVLLRVTASHFLVVNKETDLKPSSLLLFRVFLTPSNIAQVFECYLLGLLLKNNNIFFSCYRYVRIERKLRRKSVVRGDAGCGAWRRCQIPVIHSGFFCVNTKLVFPCKI